MKVRIQLLVLGLFLAGACTQLVAAGSPPDGPRVYVFQEGDTLASVAERTLGRPDLVPELLKLNNIQNPAAVVRGTVLALPGPERQEAIVALAGAAEAMTRALDAEALTYAPEEFNIARAAFVSAEENLDQASYSKGLSLALVSLEAARRAEDAANRAAKIQRPATLKQAVGRVDILQAGGAWQELHPGEWIPVGSRLRTEPGARAEVELADGSIIIVDEASELSLEDLLHDRRSGMNQTRLQVLMGEITGRIPKKKTEDSTFEIKTGKASIAIRGTELRVNRDAEEDSRVMTLEGELAVAARGKQTGVKEGFGTVVRKSSPPMRPVELIPPPELAPAWRSAPVTAVQQVQLAWEPVGKRRASAFRVELARDDAFLDVVQREQVKENRLTSDVLGEGRYYWRVACLDEKGLLGLWGETGRFDVERNLAIAMALEGVQEELASGLHVRGGTRLTARPAQADSSVSRILWKEQAGASAEIGKDGVVLLRHGPQDVQAWGVGADGEQGPVQSRSFFVDARPPEVTWKISEPYDRYYGLYKIRVELKAVDDSGVKALDYQVVRQHGIRVRKHQGGNVDRGVRLRGVTDYEAPFELLMPGRYVIRVSASDVLGNTTNAILIKVAPAVAQ